MTQADHILVIPSACSRVRYRRPIFHPSVRLSTFMSRFDIYVKVSISGGTSVGNHNRSSVGIGCCCRCDFPIIIGS